jgi:2,4-dienoyl-CoA reductase (NADPH2)
VPTIVTSVPRGAFASLAGRLRLEVTIPVVASNRINMPAEAEGILQRGEADMISMARPFLADSHFVVKAAEGRADEINTCIGCNQACLDHTFSASAPAAW